MSSSSSSSQQQAEDMGGDGDCPSSSSNCSTPSPPQLKLYQAFIFVTPIVFTIVLLLLFCCLYIRRRRQHMRATTQIRAQFFTRGLFSAVRSIFPFFSPPHFFTLFFSIIVSLLRLQLFLIVGLNQSRITGPVAFTILYSKTREITA